MSRLTETGFFLFCMKPLPENNSIVHSAYHRETGKKRTANSWHRTRLLGICVLLSLLLFGVAVLSGCAEQPVSGSLYALDTYIQIKLYRGKNKQQALESALARIQALEGKFSRTLDGSDIHTLNNAKGMPVEVSPEVAQVIRAGIEYGELSQGQFDISIAPVSSLWDFHAQELPDPEQVTQALAYVNYRAVQVQGNTVTLPPGYALDLGGIAKGYIADQVAQLLAGQGITEAMLDMGGNIVFIGEKSTGELWRAGIRKPFGEAGTYVGIYHTPAASVSSSGVYERFFRRGGEHYHHILDPRTGWPVETDLHAVSVVAPDSMAGDALSTIGLMVGEQAFTTLIADMEGIQALFIYADGHMSEVHGKNPAAEFQGVSR